MIRVQKQQVLLYCSDNDEEKEEEEQQQQQLQHEQQEVTDVRRLVDGRISRRTSIQNNNNNQQRILPYYCVRRILRRTIPTTTTRTNRISLSSTVCTTTTTKTTMTSNKVLPTTNTNQCTTNTLSSLSLSSFINTEKIINQSSRNNKTKNKIMLYRDEIIIFRWMKRLLLLLLLLYIVIIFLVSNSIRIPVVQGFVGILSSSSSSSSSRLLLLSSSSSTSSSTRRNVLPNRNSIPDIIHHYYYSPSFVQKKQQHQQQLHKTLLLSSSSSSLGLFRKKSLSFDTIIRPTSLSSLSSTVMKCTMKNSYQCLNDNSNSNNSSNYYHHYQIPLLFSSSSSFVYQQRIRQQQQRHQHQLQQRNRQDRTILFMTVNDNDNYNNNINESDIEENNSIDNEITIINGDIQETKSKRRTKVMKTASKKKTATKGATDDQNVIIPNEASIFDKKRKSKKTKSTTAKSTKLKSSSTVLPAPDRTTGSAIITSSDNNIVQKNLTDNTKKDHRSIDNKQQQQQDDTDDDIDIDIDVDDDDEYYYNAVEIPGNEEYDTPSNIDDILTMTVAQLQQQLRLRGLKVTGKKDELIQRLVTKRNIDIDIIASSDTTDTADDDSTTDTKGTTNQNKSINNKYEPIDVTAYLDDDNKEKDVYTASISSNDDNTIEEANPVSKDPEVWGSEARIVTDYNGQQLVIDNLSRTKIEFIGSNQSTVDAYVVASRDALKPYMAGGSRNNRIRNQTTTTTTTASRNNNNDGDPYESVVSAKTIVQNSERIVQNIQKQREDADSKRPIRFEDSNEVIDEGDENRILTDVILNRDYSDWGKYSVTGEQISAAEVAGVILLSDIYGPFTDDTKTLAEKIAFECQPIVVMVPDLFNGIPWQPTSTSTTIIGGPVNEYGQTVDEWRASVHDDIRVSVTIRAAAACLRERYGVSSIIVFGTCYGGGRALEVAANYLPSIYDIDTVSIGPPLVYPTAVIAWYPTRYHSVTNLFGPKRTTTTTTNDPELQDHKVAILCLFAEKDTIPGATKDDAVQLKALLEQDDRIKDYMVKIFPNQDHGFAHIGINRQRNLQLSTKSSSSFDDYNDGDDDDLNFLDNEFGGSGKLNLYEGDAEVACLLSTAFMETYSRVFLPTIGTPVAFDTEATSWNTDTIEMTYDYIAASKQRDIRKEIDDAVANYVDPPFESGRMIDPTDTSQEEELINLLRSMESPEQANGGKYKILDDDDLPTIYAKLTAADNDFQIF